MTSAPTASSSRQSVLSPGRPKQIHDIASWRSSPAVARIFDACVEVFSPPPRRVTRVRNRWSLEASSFDESRERRAPHEAELAELDERCRAEEGCAFCDDAMWTDTERATRSGDARCVAPRNGFCGLHTLVVPRTHDPHDFSEATLGSMLDASEAWLDGARRGHPPEAAFISWNVLCGSAIHGHAQVTLSSGFPEGGVSRALAVARTYESATGCNYWADLVRAHEEAGLSVAMSAARGFAALAPVKEREIWVVGPTAQPLRLGADFRRLLRASLRSLSEVDVVRPAINAAIHWVPGLARGEALAIARLIDRGWPLLGVPDWASMETYGTSVVATDPFDVAERLRRALEGD